MANQIDAAETAKGDAQLELEALRKKKQDALQAISAILYPLNSTMNAYIAARHSIDDTLTDLLFDEWEEIQSRIVAADNALADAEDRDLRRSSPIVL